MFPRDPETWRWRLRRWTYGAALFAWFAAIAFYFGPNKILFGKLTGLTPADFVNYAQRQVVPEVIAVKRYEREHGKLPEYGEDLSPFAPAEHVRYAQVWNGRLYVRGPYNQSITYNFADDGHPWRVDGVFVRGPIPLPPVVLPSTDPTTQPTTAP